MRASVMDQLESILANGIPVNAWRQQIKLSIDNETTDAMLTILDSKELIELSDRVWMTVQRNRL